MHEYWNTQKTVQTFYRSDTHFSVIIKNVWLNNKFLWNSYIFMENWKNEALEKSAFKK